MAKVAKKEIAKVDPKEKHAVRKLGYIEELMRPLVVDGAIVVSNQAGAEIASILVNTEIPVVEKLIEELWGEDCKSAYDLYVSIRDKRDRFAKPLKEKRVTLQQAVGRWMHAEREKREEEARKQQEQLDQDMPEAGVVVQADTVSVSNLSLRGRRAAKVVDALALIKAISTGKAPLNVVLWNVAVLNEMARNSWDAANKVTVNGETRRYIVNGSIELVEEFATARR